MYIFIIYGFISDIFITLPHQIQLLDIQDFVTHNFRALSDT